METAKVNGVELEFEVTGSGEPLLLISPVLADGFVPLVAEPSLADRYQLIRYHKRGWAGSTHPTTPVSVSDHAADAAALLDYLGVPRAHVAGHSSGAAVAAQLALDEPERVGTLVLLELFLFSVPSGQAFLEGAAPVLEAYTSGHHEAALSMFLSAVSGLDRAACRVLLDERVPGAVAQALKDIDTFFGVELPALTQWTFGAGQAAAIRQPVLSVLGSETAQLWVDVAEFLRTSIPRVEERTIEGVGHLLHIQQPEPVAQAIAQFLGRHPLADRDIPSEALSDAPEATGGIPCDSAAVELIAGETQEPGNRRA
jgi:pimeloyl-ACP methyl ester carboxylesterase